MGQPPLQTADRTDERWPAVLDRYEKRILGLDQDAAEEMYQMGGETVLWRIGDTAFPVTISVEDEPDGAAFVLRAFDGEGDEPFEMRWYRWVRGGAVVRTA
jgi:hypothetical protein